MALAFGPAKMEVGEPHPEASLLLESHFYPLSIVKSIELAVLIFDEAWAF
jgi:hypothetical protein